ncbi:MAG TPA: amidohydrolase family protein [Phycisphaerae bacterium]|nr:amidohydrolase family protein [Phycisphaerae bacterium]
MIVDCHTSIWQSPEQLGTEALDRMAQSTYFGREAVRLLPKADTASHLLSSEPVDYCFVLGFRSKFLDAQIPPRFIADYCSEHADRMIAFAGIDPMDADAPEQLDRITRGTDFRGLVICPAAQDFHPCDTRAMSIYEQAAKAKLPIIFSPGPYMGGRSRLSYAHPILLDEVAGHLPQLKIMIAHLGYPWIDETIALLGKHKNVLANLAGLLRRPWIAYDALVRAHQMDVIDQLLFGSDFPFASAADCIETLYNINQFASGTPLPVIPRSLLRKIVERPVLDLLGIRPAAGQAPAPLPRTRRVSRGS